MRALTTQEAVHRPHFERCGWCEATVYRDGTRRLGNDSPALHVCTAPVGRLAPARKERSMKRLLTTTEARVADLADRASEALERFAVAWREEMVKIPEDVQKDPHMPLDPDEEASAARVRDCALDVREATAALAARLPGIVVGEEA